ncbi:MAG: hypothetical protein ACUVXJ_19235 [Phycisphaerae bacterium]
MKFQTVARLRAICAVAILAAVLAAAMPMSPVPRRVQTTPDPNDPEKTRTIIPREEREKLGLTPRTWTGVVDPEVYARLDRLNKTVAELKDRLKKGRDVEAFDALWRIRFKGMVYVQVQLKDRDAQRRVLASLKASEFHAPYLFEKSVGLTGYITKEGLDKLAKNPDVTGVCLDDKPLPGPGKIMAKDLLPPAKPGEAANEPGVPEKKVDPDVYRAFALGDRVDVAVSLRVELPSRPEELPSDLVARNELREQAGQQVQDRVLSALTANEFWLSSRHESGMSGSVTKEGLQKLWRHPDVQRISFPPLMRVPELHKKN